MSYRCGIGPGMAALGMTPCEPHILCDQCGAQYELRARPVPPAWFLNGKAPPGWVVSRLPDGTRYDFCPKCQELNVPAVRVKV